MIRRFAGTAALLALAACSSNPEPQAAPTTPPPAATTPPPVTKPPVTAAAFDPVGSFSFLVDVMGQSQPGTLTITRGSDGALNGKLSDEAGQELPLKSVVQDGKKVTVVGGTPNGAELAFVLTFEDNDKFSGTFRVMNIDGKVSGTRKK